MSYEKYLKEILSVFTETFDPNLKNEVLRKSKLKINQLNKVISKRGKFYNFILKVLFRDYYLNRIERGLLLRNEFVSLLEFIGVEKEKIENEFSSAKPVPKFILLPEVLKNPGNEFLGELTIFSNNLNVVKINLREHNSGILEFAKKSFLYSNYENSENAIYLKIQTLSEIIFLKFLIWKFKLKVSNFREYLKLIKNVLSPKIKNQEVENLKFCYRPNSRIPDELLINDFCSIIYQGVSWAKSRKYLRLPKQISKYSKVEHGAVYLVPIRGIIEMLFLNSNVYPDVKFKLLENVLESEDYFSYIKTYKLEPFDENSSNLNLPGATLYPYQRAAIEVGIEKIYETNSVLIADPMGAGKTVEALGIVHYLNQNKGLIVCPAIMKHEWKRALQKFLNVLENDIAVLESNPNKFKKYSLEELKEKKYLIINYDILQKWENVLLTHDFEFVLFDEAHYLKNMNSKRTKSAHTLSKKIPVKILLTGTPLMNRIEELWSILKLTGIETKFARTKVEFLEKYSYLKYIRIGRRKIPRSDGIKNASELSFKLRRYLMIRRPKKQILKFLPPKLRKPFYIQLTEKETEKYLKIFIHESDPRKFLEEKLTKTNNQYLKSKIEAVLETNDPFHMAEYIIKNHPEMFLSMYSKLYSELGKIKVPYVINFVKEVFVNKILEEEPESKLVIFAHHIDVQKKIYEEIGKLGSDLNPLKLTADMNSEQRDNVVNEFQHNPGNKILVASLGAAKEGLTLTAANTMLFAEMWWNPQDLSQAEDRIHRISQNKNVEIYYLISQLDNQTAKKMLTKNYYNIDFEFARKTIDEIIWDMIQEKMDTFQKVVS